MNVVAMGITKDLHFNMARSFDVLFHEHPVITETLHGFSLCSLDLIHELVLCVYDSHTFATSSKHCFQHDWETDFFSLSQDMIWILIFTVIALEHGHACVDHNFLRFTF